MLLQVNKFKDLVASLMSLNIVSFNYIGPDHLAALIAPSVGKSGLHGLKIGALWGVGHGFTAISLGLSAYFLKGQFTGRLAVVSKLSSVAESIVGLSILYIGLMGIKESRDAELEAKLNNHDHQHNQLNHSDSQSSNSDGALSTRTSTTSTTSYRAILANGMLHGFSWDGVPSLAPAVTMSSWTGALSFLSAYSLGTIVAMSLAAGTMGELSTRVGKASNNPDLPRKFSFASSVAAVTIGLYLTAKSIFLRQ